MEIRDGTASPWADTREEGLGVKPYIMVIGGIWWVRKLHWYVAAPESFSFGTDGSFIEVTILNVNTVLDGLLVSWQIFKLLQQAVRLYNLVQDM